ncbi:MAG: DUF4349 domain-containing protein [Chloroflexi bacterium]|nr:DUF4349 domain-containing protein [Chloroflexota bacterium]
MSKSKLSRAILSGAVAALVLVACGGGDESQETMVEYIAVEGESDIAMAAPMAAPAESLVAGRAFDDTDGGGFNEELNAQSVDRIVIKNADLSVVVEDPAASMDAISVLAEEMDGYVVSSNLYQTYLDSGVEVPEANITFRIPAEMLLEALEQIESDANEVLSKNISGQDVTREYTDLQSRLRNLNNAEEQLREIMASAFKTEDVLAVYHQLSQITQEIEMINGQIQYFDQASALSAISVTLIAVETVEPLTIGGWEPVGIAKDAVQALITTLQGLVNAVIWLALYLLPTLVVILIPFWLLWRVIKAFLGRRRKKVVEAESKS